MRHNVVLRWRFWLVLLGAPILWLVHFLLSYLYNEATCFQSGLPSNIDRVVLFAGSIFFALASFLIAYSTLCAKYRFYFEENPVLLETAFLISILFTFVMLVEAVGIFFIKGCF